MRRADLSDLDRIAPLFHAYREFYRLAPEPERARNFLRDRLERGESIIFLALDCGDACGFTQLFASFSSGALARIFILNDLFVAPHARNRGIGSRLLTAASEFGRNEGAARLVLSTEVTNQTAQRVYERQGWKRDTQFLTYNLALPNST